jgi:transposase
MKIDEILEIRQFKVKDLSVKNDEVLIYGGLQDTDKTCPYCNTLAIKPHQYHEKRLRTLPFNGKPTYLVFIHTAYLCTSCGRRFLERTEFFEKQRVYTIAYEEYIYEQAKKQDITRVAELEGLNWHTINSLFLKGRKRQEKSIKSTK